MANEQTIIRSKKGVKDKYTLIDNASILQNKKLSLKEKGLLCFLLSLPDTWVINKKSLCNFSTDGRDLVVAAFDKLVKLGFIQAIPDDRKIGKLKYPTYVVHEIPVLDPKKFDTETLENPNFENQNTDFPDDEIPTGRINRPVGTASVNPPLQKTIGQIPEEETEEHFSYSFFPPLNTLLTTSYNACEAFHAQHPAFKNYLVKTKFAYSGGEDDCLTVNLPNKERFAVLSPVTLQKMTLDEISPLNAKLSAFLNDPYFEPYVRMVDDEWFKKQAAHDKAVGRTGARQPTKFEREHYGL